MLFVMLTCAVIIVSQPELAVGDANTSKDTDRFSILFILIAFGALAIGFGLAFGLGGRDVMGGILAGYYIRQRLAAGDTVSVAGFEGTVRDGKFSEK